MNNKKNLFLFILTTFLLTILWQYLPSSDKDSYFLFADNLTRFGINNCSDVLSNLGFLVASIYGLFILKSSNKIPISYKTPLITIIVGAFLTCFGSAYFHNNPNSDTLFWDRMPMTIGFSGVVILMLMDRLHYHKLVIPLSIVLVMTGLLTVFGWHTKIFTLRPYLIVQYGCLIFTFLTLLLTKPSYIKTGTMLFALSFYVLAKLTEKYDILIFNITSNAISGHTIKHLLAAVAIFLILHQFKKPFDKVS